MKKILTSLVGVMSVIAVANAEPYVGVNAIYNNAKFTQPELFNDMLERNEFGASVDLGYQFFDYLGAEAYFQYNLPSSTDWYIGDTKLLETKSNFMSGGLDVLGYLPLNSCHSLNLIGTVGGGYYRFEVKYKGIENDTEHENHLALRMGAGFQYNFNESMSIRALGRFITWKSDFDNDFDVMKNMWEGSVGFQYKF